MATASYPATRLNPLLRAQLAQLGAEQVLELLGEILEPSIDNPFRYDNEQFDDALHRVTAAYQASYGRLRDAAEGLHADPDASFFDRVDRLYDETRDGRAAA